MSRSETRGVFRLLACGLLLSCFRLPPSAFALPSDPDWHELIATGQLVEIQRVDPTILVELRYATTHNCVGAALYPPDFPCLARPETAVRLHLVQNMLHGWGYRLKIWDAYRPKTAHQKLWEKFSRHGYVADPATGLGSLHSWGLAVDLTMVDLLGHEVTMPSDFDVFTPDASAIYKGTDAKAAGHLHLLQSAMGAAGFFGLTTEWWHFAVRDWTKSKPLAIPAGKAPPLPLEEGTTPLNAKPDASGPPDAMPPQ